MKKYCILAVSLLFLLALITGALAAQVQEIEEKTFALAEGGSVSVENVAGDIVIYAWDEDQVKMIATKSARAFTKKRAEELIEAIDIDISANEDQIDIDTEFPWWNRLDPTSSVRVTSGLHSRQPQATFHYKRHKIGERGQGLPIASAY